jgi:uncharacterized protein (DUF736 family)
MNIGEFKNTNGRLRGMIATADIHLARLALRPVESSHERAPKYELVTLNAGNVWVALGGLWEATMKKTGEAFLQGTIDQPGWAMPIPIALFSNGEGGYRVAWRREQTRDFASSEPAGRGGYEGDARGGYQGDAPGGFGGSTAGDDGRLVGAGTDLDDDVPF